MTRVEQIVGGEVNNLLDFGTGVGNSIPFLVQYFLGTGLFGTDVSDKSLTLVKERFDGFGEFSLFNGKTLPYPEGQFDLALLLVYFITFLQMNI